MTPNIKIKKRAATEKAKNENGDKLCFTTSQGELCVPHFRIEEFLNAAANAEQEVSPWRIFRIMAEFVNGFDFLKQYTKAVSFFGTARCNAEDQVYQEAEKLAGKLARDGFAVITGGGPGLMEAANKGAAEAGGTSVGINIRLPLEQRINKYVKESESFKYFFTRKVMLSSASQVYIFFPGGYGTLDELFEMLTLVQTKKISPIPIILVRKSFWKPLVSWLKDEALAKNGAIDESDLRLFSIVDTADEAYDFISEALSKGKRHAH